MGWQVLMLDEWLSQRIEKTKEAGLYREFRTMNTAPLPEMLIDGQSRSFFHPIIT